MPSAPSITLLYAADPMCSWCYGFAPVLDQALGRFAGRLGFQLLVGGLRVPPHAEPMERELKETLRHEWAAIQKRTGQPFDLSFLDRRGFLYNTEPACRAVVAVRRLAPDRERAFFHAVQRAFYAQNRDVSSAGELTGLAETQGLDTAAFQAQFDSEAAISATREDFENCRQLRVQGFPSLLLRRDHMALQITHGYQAIEETITAVEKGLSILDRS